MTSVSDAKVTSKCAAQCTTPNTSCSATHCVRVRDGLALVWPKNSSGNRFGQLGNGIANKRLDNLQLEQAPASMLIPSTKVSSVAASSSTTIPKTKPFVVAAAAGGAMDAGHTAVVLSDGSVFTCGCDRWQQLGLGSSAAGSAGYTWENGKIWRPVLQRVQSLDPPNPNDPIIDVACGADYTILRSKNGRVVGFGRSQIGQVTGNGRKGPFVTGPVHVAATKAAVTHIATDPIGDCTLLVRNLSACIGGITDKPTPKELGAWWVNILKLSAGDEKNAALEMKGRCSSSFVLEKLKNLM